MNCTDITKYSTNGLLKGLLSFQIICAFSTMVALFVTSKRVFSSALLDSAFKEHLFGCYVVHFIQAFSMLISQSLFLFQHLFRPTCEATISLTLCIISRIGISFSIFSLPTLNLTLTIIRIISFFGDNVPTKESTIRRIVLLISWIVIIGEFYWKFNDIVIVEAQVAYCAINASKDLLGKLNAESTIALVFEGLTVLLAFSLFVLYRRKNKMRRSFDISVNLARRQLMETWQLFLPYSALHAISFSAYQLLGIAYRSIFAKLLDEVSYAAGTGFIFTPTYFVAISPMLIFWIVHTREKSRLNESKVLMKMELVANDVYFQNYRNQWEYPADKGKQNQREKEGLRKFLCNFHQKIYP